MELGRNCHGRGILAHSKDGLDWKLDEKPVAYTKAVKWDDGSERQMGQIERVQGLMQDGRLTHLSFAVLDGRGGFDDGGNAWNIVVPLDADQ